MRFLPGLELCRRFHEAVVGPILAEHLPDLPYAAARIDAGSELLGFDTPRSTDHDWGPRLQLFLRPRDAEACGAEVEAVLAANLPATFLGFPTRFAGDGDARLGVAAPHGDRHGVTVAVIDEWFAQRLGFDPRSPITAFDWLATPTQRLAEFTGGAVYHDGLGGELTAARERLRWYPDDVWRYVLACQWGRIAQDEHLIGRCAEVGDELGSRLLAGRAVRDLMRLCLLLHRRYPPYGKWLGSAFARLPCARDIGPTLAGTLAADAWPDRQEQLCRAWQALARLTNAAGLCDPADATVRPFFDRPFQVLDASRFAAALRAAIGDPWLRKLAPFGAVDQHIDNTDVLCDTARTRTVARALLLGSASSAG